MQTRWRGQAQVKSTCRALEGTPLPAVSQNRRELEHPRCPTPRPSALRPHHTEATLVTLVFQGIYLTGSWHWHLTFSVPVHLLIILGRRRATQGPRTSDGLAQEPETGSWARRPPAKQRLVRALPN